MRERSCDNCRFGPECELGLERFYIKRENRWVCDPGYMGPPMDELKDIWEPKSYESTSRMSQGRG